MSGSQTTSLSTALGDEFGFTSMFVLQPSLWTDGKPLHVSERRILVEHLERRAMTHIMATRGGDGDHP